nr:hypothetical protein [Escherichia coli]
MFNLLEKFSVLIATGDETSFYIHLDVLKVGLKTVKYYANF